MYDFWYDYVKFEDYKELLKATQLENKINHPERNKVNIDSLKKDHIKV